MQALHLTKQRDSSLYSHPTITRFPNAPGTDERSLHQARTRLFQTRPNHAAMPHPAKILSWWLSTQETLQLSGKPRYRALLASSQDDRPPARVGNDRGLPSLALGLYGATYSGVLRLSANHM
jgi:hypothetical protein